MLQMKADTAIIILKASCYVLIGAGTPMAASLAQWGNSNQWPEKIQWVIILIGATVGGATQLLSYLSGSYSDYVKGRSNGAGDTTQYLLSRMQPGPTTTTPPKP